MATLSVVVVRKKEMRGESLASMEHSQDKSELPLCPEPDTDGQREPWCWQSVTVRHRARLSPVSWMLSLLLLLPLLWEGSLSQTLQMQRSVTVQEAMCVQVPCTFELSELQDYAPSPVYGYWFRKGVRINNGHPVATNDPYRWVQEIDRGRFSLLGDPRLLNCSLSITDPKLSDTGEYFFRLERGQLKFSFTMYPLYVDVTDLTQKPDIYVPEKLESGKEVTLNCSVPWVCENNKIRFSWMGDALPSQKIVPRSSPYSEVSFTPGHQHHGSNLTCQLTFIGHQLRIERTVQLNVSYPVQNVTISIAQDNNTTVFSAQENSSWPLMFTLLRGALMGAGFALTYGLTWLYYTRRP
ncbi:sialic acid-binding Ig-like lectin 14 [Sarcophilus harrisii]